MNSIIIELKPSSELMLAADEIVRAINRMADALEAASKRPIPATPATQDFVAMRPSRSDVLAKVAASIPKAPAQPIAANFAQVQTWAVQRGLAFGVWDDLPVINARREGLGLAPFKREFPVKGRVG